MKSYAGPWGWLKALARRTIAAQVEHESQENTAPQELQKYSSECLPLSKILLPFY